VAKVTRDGGAGMGVLMNIAEGTALAALALNVVVALVGLTWGLSKIRDTIRDEIETHRIAFDADIDGLRREFGETAQAIRQKINDVEIWGRDNYVKKDSFTTVTDRISREILSIAERLDKRLERMEIKIDAAP
jgi:hypothetical protein